MAKRKEGMPLDAFRLHMLNTHCEFLKVLPGLRRLMVNFVTDSSYTLGESLLDMVVQLWFDDVESLNAAMRSPEMDKSNRDDPNFVNSRYVFSMIVREHWIIGPEPRQ
jgi:uncharacterized protein (TIGR02118 family)